MIKEPISGYLECLQGAEIMHSLFISGDKCELQLWDFHKFGEVLQMLHKRGVIPNSITKEGGDDPFYIIKL